MKRVFLKSIIIFVSALALAVGFQILSGASPAAAQGPAENEEVWEGHVSRSDSPHSRTFDAPEGAVRVEVEADWKWSGQPGQNQTNESHFVEAAGDTIQCPDFGDAEFDEDGDGRGDEWVSCGSTAFERSDDLTVRVKFDGNGVSTGSHLFRVVVRWEVEQMEPATCDNLAITTNSGTIPLQVQATIQHTNGQSAQIDWGAGQENEDLSVFSSEYTYREPGQYEITAYVETGAGELVTSPDCTAMVQANSTKGSVSVTKIDEQVRPWAGVTVKLYLADGTLVAEDVTPAFFTGLEHGDYYIEESVPPGSKPLGPTRFDFTINGQHLHHNVQFRNARDDCHPLDISPRSGDAPLTVSARIEGGTFSEIDWGDGARDQIDNSLPGLRQHIEHTYTDPGKYQIVAWVSIHGGTTRHCAVVLVEKPSIPTTGQYQDFIGPVAFGNHTPYLEPGKEYFDSTQSMMFNVEYITAEGQAELVFRQNGQEIADVTTSIFHAGDFRQIESGQQGRAVTTLKEGVTKLIAYRYGNEQARIFQTKSDGHTRWIHPLDQPFEHKHQFQLELHGPPGVVDLLVYRDEQRQIQYGQNGTAVVHLNYRGPGLAAIYRIAAGGDVVWTTVDRFSYPAGGEPLKQYRFGESGLYYYRIIDGEGQPVTGPYASGEMIFKAEPGVHYQAQLAYPETSLFVGLYGDMKFEHPDYWLMPVDGRYEHAFEFHLDYHRQPDPNLENDHIRGDVVVDALYLLNGTTSVAQQFPYGRHDGVLPGVTIVGIPDVSMIAFCQRPGVHEMVYWGGWENESYYLPDRGRIFDQELYDRWTEGQRRDCIDAARRVNMTLAREGLRTSHTYRYHGEESQGYQMVQKNAWSPYNLVDMRSPHIGRFLKPGTVLPYYEAPEDVVFWGWDLEKGQLDKKCTPEAMREYVESLGPVVYYDQTGIHPPEKWGS